ncbi:hypothetical protein ACFY15_31925 [Streptomyces sp. NPDC001373]|uniref:hypothetical protein n=1 Tax=Streptomyces sp. NPDC001373 TaxID=3364565 RepID=UPI0036B60310
MGIAAVPARTANAIPTSVVLAPVQFTDSVVTRVLGLTLRTSGTVGIAILLNGRARIKGISAVRAVTAHQPVQVVSIGQLGRALSGLSTSVRAQDFLTLG